MRALGIFLGDVGVSARGLYVIVRLFEALPQAVGGFGCQRVTGMFAQEGAVGLDRLLRVAILLRGLRRVIKFLRIAADFLLSRCMKFCFFVGPKNDDRRAERSEGAAGCE